MSMSKKAKDHDENIPKYTALPEDYDPDKVTPLTSRMTKEPPG